jgi:tRNA pseudouridine55 synthase
MPGPSGFLVVDKPPGWTSHDVVEKARRWLGTRRIGHLGTLDPLATGVLPLAVRDATKLVPYLERNEKSYRGTIELGVRTDTLDADGKVLHRHEGPFPDRETVASALAEFVGDIEQIPPMFSAVKREGVPLHRLAREGVEVERSPKAVRIDRIEMLAYEAPLLEIDVDCSQGTYVRTLADDLGERLGCGAHLKNLRRTRSGPFTLEDASDTQRLATEALEGKVGLLVIPAVDVLGLPVVRLGPEEARRVANGNEIGAPVRFPPGTRIAAVEPEGELLAVMETRPGRRMRPVRVMQSVASPG